MKGAREPFSNFQNGFQKVKWSETSRGARTGEGGARAVGGGRRCI